jgi:hypothetical protein
MSGVHYRHNLLDLEGLEYLISAVYHGNAIRDPPYRKETSGI